MGSGTARKIGVPWPSSLIRYTPSMTRMWKCGLTRNDESARWIAATAPTCPLSPTPQRSRWRLKISLMKMRKTADKSLRSTISEYLMSKGSESPQCRTGAASGNTRSTRWAAVAAIRFAPHDAQAVLRLQENGMSSA